MVVAHVAAALFETPAIPAMKYNNPPKTTKLWSDTRRSLIRPTHQSSRHYGKLRLDNCNRLFLGTEVSSKTHQKFVSFDWLLEQITRRLNLSYTIVELLLARFVEDTSRSGNAQVIVRSSLDGSITSTRWLYLSWDD